MLRRLLLVGIVLSILAACSNDTSKDTKDTDTTTDYRTELLSFPQDPPQDLPTLPLTRSDGSTFDLSASGKLTLVYFGFTACPDICPGTLTELRKAYKELGEPRDQLNIVFVTIDPERDTADNIDRFLSIYSTDFIGLTGDEAQLTAAKDFFDVIAVKVELEDSALGYTMDHTANIFVISPQGDYIAQFIHGATASTLTHDIRLFLEHET